MVCSRVNSAKRVEFARWITQHSIIYLFQPISSGYYEMWFWEIKDHVFSLCKSELLHLLRWNCVDFCQLRSWATVPLGYKHACCFTNDSASKWHYHTITPDLRGEIGYFYWNQNNYISIFTGFLHLPWENILRKKEDEVFFLCILARVLPFWNTVKTS